MQEKIGKKFLVFEIIACEWVALNCLYSEENTINGSHCVNKQS